VLGLLLALLPAAGRGHPMHGASSTTPGGGTTPQ
jgi:hypothetical protein